MGCRIPPFPQKPFHIHLPSFSIWDMEPLTLCSPNMLLTKYDMTDMAGLQILAMQLMNAQRACGFFPSLTTVFSEALVAEFAQSFKAVVEVPHFMLQVRVLLVQLGLFGVPLQWGDHILVYFCWWEQKKGGEETAVDS